LEIDDTLAEAHIPLGVAKIQYDWDWSGGEREFQRAIVLNGSSARAHPAYGFVFLGGTGRFEEAIVELKRVQELDPLLLLINGNLGILFFSARQYDQAIEQERKTLDLDANFIVPHWYLG
jgi:tetratricopeptide (TPR) repeat protein